ncbi:MAG: hypothetical protein COB20_05335 [SAR86 cluster bacterium]|uniref:Uncharacterized protein n=1 Tax=SAR86 cluster bacterium TaxID=2030880 RepID=A0A2A4X9P9_9GAMM|nr:MAG: hypothetical protein COB20_05335 [SAR86 cluster bacterium]
MLNLLTKALSKTALIVAALIFVGTVLADSHTAIERAVANDARPDADRQRDADRKPAHVLEFFGIEPGIIRSDLVSAGFEFVSESDILRNRQDSRNKPMSDPSVRGKTDRVVMKFRKPAS